jgi:replication factor C subunit 2/4
VCVTNCVFSPELSKTRILELNASDERGISIVREKVKNFARISVSAPSEASRKAHPCPPFKIIILDEADSMTSDAQSALRRTMETYSKTTRFCLICNYVTRIIDPLASRCAKFRFRPLDENNALERLRFIADEEKLDYECGVLESLLRSSEGDLRKAITFLQSSAKLTGTATSSAAGSSGGNTDGDDVVMADADDGEVLANAADRPTRITVRMVQEIAGVIPEDVINGLVAATKPANTRVTGFGEAVFRNLVKVVEEVIFAGWSASQILTQLHDRILLDDEYSGEQKNRISWTLSEAETRLTDGADEHIEILNVLTQIAKAIF